MSLPIADFRIFQTPGRSFGSRSTGRASLKGYSSTESSSFFSSSSICSSSSSRGIGPPEVPPCYYVVSIIISWLSPFVSSSIYGFSPTIFCFCAVSLSLSTKLSCDSLISPTAFILAGKGDSSSSMSMRGVVTFYFFSGVSISFN